MAAVTPQEMRRTREQQYRVRCEVATITKWWTAALEASRQAYCSNMRLVMRASRRCSPTVSALSVASRVTTAS